MSAFAGIYLRKKAHSVRSKLLFSSVLRAASSVRPTSGEVIRIELHDALLFKYDIGVFDDRGAFQDDKNGIALLAGHPYLDGPETQPRAVHLFRLAADAQSGGNSELSRARGAFALAHLRADHSRLTLATDWLGIRPLYYFEDSEVVIFSTSIGLFQDVDGIDLGLDERGAIEKSVTGYSLFERTAYRSIRCLEGASTVEFSDSHTEKKKYFEWRSLVATDTPQEQQSRLIHQFFQDAVRLRLGEDKHAKAFLTGGLDSRCVVSALLTEGAVVDTLNFAPSGSQDLELGEQVAACFGTNHFSCPLPPASVASNVGPALRLWSERLPTEKNRANAATIVWSGDGGSVGLGHVYITDRLVDLMERDEKQKAIESMLTDGYLTVPTGILRGQLARRAGTYLLEEFMEELHSLELPNNGRSLHILLLVTDQRHHLHDHYEKILEHGCELQLPFFDRLFLESVVREPIRPFIAHRFYNRWLAEFPTSVRKVPWQAYKGHEPCPLPVSSDLGYQWSEETQEQIRRTKKQKVCRDTLKALLRDEYPKEIVSRSGIAAALALTWLGVRDYYYALSTALFLRDLNIR